MDLSHVAIIAALQHGFMVLLPKMLSSSMMKTGMKPKSILIKKYENRRLYDATSSRYVNLDEVAKMLQNGANVRVIDATTGEDITRLILTQIIVEDAKTPDSTFPLDVLRQMVIASGRASHESALQYMKAVMDISQTSYRAMVPPFNPFQFIQPKDSTLSGAPVPRPDTYSGESGDEQEKKRVGEDVNELKHRLAELEALVSKLAPKKVVRKKEGPPRRVPTGSRKRP